MSIAGHVACLLSWSSRQIVLTCQPGWNLNNTRAFYIFTRFSGDRVLKKRRYTFFSGSFFMILIFLKYDSNTKFSFRPILTNLLKLPTLWFSFFPRTFVSIYKFFAKIRCFVKKFTIFWRKLPFREIWEI